MATSHSRNAVPAAIALFNNLPFRCRAETAASTCAYNLKYVQFIISRIAAHTTYNQDNNEASQGGLQRMHTEPQS